MARNRMTLPQVVSSVLGGEDTVLDGKEECSIYCPFCGHTIEQLGTNGIRHENRDCDAFANLGVETFVFLVNVANKAEREGL